jgi:monoamine oxidase
MNSDQRIAEKRRELLKMTAALTAATAAGPLFGQTTNVGQGRSVIIIGAGIAGLTAAVRLKASGFVPIILEARNRTGGRVWTDRATLGFPCDMGAGWIHGPDGNNPVTALARQANAQTYLTSDDSVKVFDATGTDVTTTQAGTWDTRYRTSLLPALDTLAKTLPNDIPLIDAIRQIDPTYLTNPSMIYPITAYGEFDSGGPIEELSTYYWRADEKYPGKDVLFPGGYDAIPNMLAQGLDIRLNTTVTAVDTSGADVRVTTASGTLNAPFVVCTLPLGVLKTNAVRFTPELPDTHRGAISRVKMGYVNKVFCEFSSAFWPTDTQYFGYHAPNKGLFAYWLSYRTFSNINCLVAIASGLAGKSIETMSQTELTNQLTTALRNMFGSNTPAPTRINPSRWNGDLLAGGAYSFANAGAANDDFKTMAVPIADKLFFAGEHCSRPYRATVHGAHLTGIAAADALIVAAGKSNPNADDDGDGIPNGVEPTVGRNPAVKDNDIFTSSRLFVMQMYRDFLTREGDAAGVDFWVGRIDRGERTRAQMAEEYVNSQEFQGRIAPVVRLMFAMDRVVPPFAPVFANVALRDGGTNLDSIGRTLYSESPRKPVYDAQNDAAFVTGFYRDLLGRAPTATEQSDGEQAVAVHLRGGFVAQLTNSQEYAARTRNEVYVAMMYMGMLRRAAEQGGFDYWVGVMRGGQSGLGLVQAFLDAPEYRNRFLPRTN